MKRLLLLTLPCLLFAPILGAQMFSKLNFDLTLEEENAENGKTDATSEPEGTALSEPEKSSDEASKPSSISEYLFGDDDSEESETKERGLTLSLFTAPKRKNFPFIGVGIERELGGNPMERFIVACRYEASWDDDDDTVNPVELTYDRRTQSSHFAVDTVAIEYPFALSLRTSTTDENALLFGVGGLVGLANVKNARARDNQTTFVWGVSIRAESGGAGEMRSWCKVSYQKWERDYEMNETRFGLGLDLLWGFMPIEFGYMLRDFGDEREDDFYVTLHFNAILAVAIPLAILALST